MSEEGQARERELILACRRGSHEAFRQLYDTYREKGFRLARRFLGSNEDALDALQEAFLKAWSNLENFQFKSGFGTWFYRIVVNTCLDRRRGGATEKADAHFEEEMTESYMAVKSGAVTGSGEEKLALEELEAGLAAAIEKLSEEQRAVFCLRVMEDMPYDEIARVLDIAEGTVMSRLFYARKQLKEELKGYL